jgi:hypothetical protein
MLNNLDTYVGALNLGARPSLFQAGFLHREPKGVIAIDQRGPKGSLRESRLYVYTHEERHTVYLITIGDKNTQKTDIRDCRRFVDAIRKES